MSEEDPILRDIVNAFRDGDYRAGRHVWENYLFRDDRPSPLSVVACITDDAPKIVKLDPNASRGAEAYIVGLADTGRPLYIEIGFATRPYVIITAWHITRQEYGRY